MERQVILSDDHFSSMFVDGYANRTVLHVYGKRDQLPDTHAGSVSGNQRADIAGQTALRYWQSNR